MAANTPGPLCASNAKPIDVGTHCLQLTPTPQPTGTLSAVKKSAGIEKDIKILAAVVYGECSISNIFEEMAAIANVLVRQQTARDYSSISNFITTNKTFAFAAHDGNQRYSMLMSSVETDIFKDIGMNKAVLAAQNALDLAGKDYSNGAYFWDGADIKTNFSNHAKVKVGIHFTEKKHDIYSIGDKDVLDESWWIDKDGNKTKSRGKWQYVYQSTAAFGGTIFWKYNPNYIKATGNKVYN